MKITLTFDNGPTPGVTDTVLRTLAEHEVPAIFFVVGSRLVEAGVDFAEAAVADGHRVGNHTWSHSAPLGTFASPARVRDEILRTQEILDSVTSERLFRPVGGGPGGVIDDTLLCDAAIETLREGDFTVALWNNVPHDWEMPHGWVDPAVDALTDYPHSVVVIHDTATRAMEHLPDFIRAARAVGGEFVNDLPSSVTPLRGGHEIHSLDRYRRSGS